MSAVDEITDLLHRAHAGDTRARDTLMPHIYDALRRLAHRALGSRDDDARGLNTTALVHEAYLNLFALDASPNWRDRAQFFAYAATAMRGIVIDQARRAAALKHGGDQTRLDLDAQPLAITTQAEELIALDAALTQLGKLEPRLASVVELRYFGGLSVDETAAALDIAPRSVDRAWDKARAFLYAALR